MEVSQSCPSVIVQEGKLIKEIEADLMKQLYVGTVQVYLGKGKKLTWEKAHDILDQCKLAATVLMRD